MATEEGRTGTCVDRGWFDR